MQVGIGLDVVKLAAFDQRTEHSPSMSAAVAAREEMILSSKSNRPDCSFNWVRIKLDAAIVQEARQTIPARERVADRFGERAATGYKRKLRFEPEPHGIDNGLGPIAARREAVCWRLTANFGLDGTEFGDPAQGLSRNRRSRRFDNFVKFAPRVAPTCGKNNVLLFGELLEASIAVDMKNAFEVRKMCNRPLGLAIRRKQIDRGWRFRPTPRSLLAGVNPETSSLRPPTSWIEHRHRRVIGEQMIRGEHVLAQAFMQLSHQQAPPTHPASVERGRSTPWRAKICDWR